ncbi:MAG: hypothetical protein A3I05_08010 [Deltaproteobacteria bacterium RIFCSPLOWO2_02_FULL_44_10]|nr:MAG: hypothetical protein A3I05_08010 [Deltaproteobacteria bacterium RIFCSPLOWO2_02_FULL_44_10]
MKKKIYATIDIGTNSVLLLIAEMDTSHHITVLEEDADITQLGEGLAALHIISPAAVERTIDVLQRYLVRCKAERVEKIIAVGTEALRRAKNAPAVLQEINTQTGIEIEVISPEREAWLTYLAATRDFGEDITVMDIGGGSTEFIAGKAQLLSIPIGSVTLTESYLPSNPATLPEQTTLVNIIDEHLKTYLKNPSPWKKRTFVATAGTATTIAAMHLKLDSYDQARVHGLSMTQHDVTSIEKIVLPLTTQERAQLPGLHPKRAPFILAGSILLERAMHYLGYDCVMVSDRGLRWGLLYSKITNN